MVVLEKGKGYVLEIRCSVFQALIGPKTEEIEIHENLGTYYYETICKECGTRIYIPKSLVPNEVKNTLIHKLGKNMVI